MSWKSDGIVDLKYADALVQPWKTLLETNGLRDDIILQEPYELESCMPIIGKNADWRNMWASDKIAQISFNNWNWSYFSSVTEFTCLKSIVVLNLDFDSLRTKCRAACYVSWGHGFRNPISTNFETCTFENFLCSVWYFLTFTFTDMLVGYNTVPTRLNIAGPPPPRGILNTDLLIYMTCFSFFSFFYKPFFTASDTRLLSLVSLFSISSCPRSTYMFSSFSPSSSISPLLWKTDSTKNATISPLLFPNSSHIWDDLLHQSHLHNDLVLPVTFRGCQIPKIPEPSFQ